MQDFRATARAALAIGGIEIADEDLEVLAAIAPALDPGMQALDAADLRELPLESDLDPSRAPRARECGP